MSAQQPKRMAPLQGHPMRDIYHTDGPMQLPAGRGTRHPPMPSMQIPWEESEYAWRGYALLGHGDQSHETLCRRGGFGILEFLVLRAIADAEKADHAGNAFWAHDLEGSLFARLRTLSNAEILSELRRGAPAPHCSSCRCFEKPEGPTGG